MKKLYTTLLAAAATLAVSAQQLPNAGFEEAWVDCIPFVASGSGTSNANSTKQGTTPTSWMISNTRGSGGTGATTVGSQVSGRNSSTAVKLDNVELKVFTVTKQIPGYLTLGTPWSTSTGTGSNMDGGTFGGINFTYRPDAVEFYYQSTGSEQPTVVAYSWSGTFVQASVPASIVVTGSPKSMDMEDRDRNILGISTSKGGSITQSGTTISTLNTRLQAETTDWTRAELPLTYQNSGNPEKFNIIFGVGDYFSTTVVKSNTLTVDDVKLLYYSRLKTLSVNGSSVPGFNSNTYYYDLSDEVEMPASADDISWAFLTNSGSSRANVELDQANLTATITVTNVNAGGTDVDGLTSHTYTIKFKEGAAKAEIPTNAIRLSGTLSVYSPELVPEKTSNPQYIYLIPEEDGSYTLAIYGFSFGDIEVGDLILPGVTRTQTAEGDKYTVHEDAFYLAALGCPVDMTVDGTMSQDRETYFLINIGLAEETAGIDATIEVEFNGQSYGGDIYGGIVAIYLEDIGFDENVIQHGNVHIIAEETAPANILSRAGEQLYTFVLPEFTLGGESLGDIIVPHLTATEVAGGTRYQGTVKHLYLTDEAHTMDIYANVDVDAVVTDAFELNANIAVNWIMDPDQPDDAEGNTLPISVTFNGVRSLAGIGGIEADTDNDAPVEYFNLQGMRVNGANLTPGIYIVRQGKNVQKVLIRK